MAEIQTYADGTPTGTDKVPYVEDPGGTPVLKLAAVSDLGGGGGGGAVPWTLREFDGTSLTNCTSIAGTWTVGSEFTQTNAANSNHGLLLASDITYATAVTGTVECEIKFPSGSGYTGIMGCNNGTPLTDGQTLAFGENAMYLIYTDSAIASTTTIVAAADVWHTLHVVIAGAVWAIYLDGVLLTQTASWAGHTGSNGLALYSQGHVSHFRNVKLWIS